MIELRNDNLVFSFPEVHPSASVYIEFQRTLRIPDDNGCYPLPPGLGRFPVRHVDDCATSVPPAWIRHGGVMLPMYASEALWLDFTARYDKEREARYPFALKIATGKINAVSGGVWADGLHRQPVQDYVVVPPQPWLDGYCVAKGVIRQFVAMPLGAGYTAEEQITGEAEHGGLQIMAIPMKREVFEAQFPKVEESPIMFSIGSGPTGRSLGLAPGGRMKQEICKDLHALSDWDFEHSSRCFVHLLNALAWRQVTGSAPPTTPRTAADYTRAGLPWFLWYDETSVALPGNETLSKMKSVATLATEKKDPPLQDNQPVYPEHIIALRRGLTRDQVREFTD